MEDVSRKHGPTLMAREVAQWCETRAEELGTEAARQFKLIVIIVVVGLVLLLVLPPLIGQIDFLTTRLFGGAPPIESLENTEDAISKLENQLSESQKRLAPLNKQLETARNNIAGYIIERDQLVARTASKLSAPLAMWHGHDPFQGKDAEVNDILVTRDGDVLAVGYEYDTNLERVLILRSADGEDWIASKPQDGNGEWIAGWLSAVNQGAKGTLFAAGYEGDIGEEETFILRSEDGMNWSAIRPTTGRGRRIKGWLNTIAETSDGTLIAAGFELLDDEVIPLILSSRNYETWTVVRPEQQEESLVGGSINALVVSQNGAIIAAGNKKASGGVTALLLRSEDARKWSAIEVANPRGGTFRGALNDLIITTEGTFIAVGTESGAGPLVLRSENGIDWDAIDLRDAQEERLKGSLSKVAESANQSLIAVGNQGNFGSLIMRSDNGRSWTALRPETVGGGAFSGGLVAVDAARDGPVYAIGQSIWKSPPEGNTYEDLLSRFTSDDDSNWPQRVKEAANQFVSEDKALSAMLGTLNSRESGYPEGTWALREEVRNLNDSWVRDRESEMRVVPLLEDAEATVAQQEDTLEKVKKGTNLLAQALTDADELRRASRIATRIAVVALLIYLVQIVVNRYRYLQRMEGFYRARAQALKLLTAMPEKAESLFKDVTVTDLMLALSPDGIGFDKSAEPPTQNMMNLFRESMRRERG